MARWCHACLMDFTKGLVWYGKPHTSSRMGGLVPGRSHYILPGVTRIFAAGGDANTSRDSHWSDADGGFADSLDGGSDRETLSRLRLARHSRFLSRLASAYTCDSRRCG